MPNREGRSIPLQYLRPNRLDSVGLVNADFEDGWNEVEVYEIDRQGEAVACIVVTPAEWDAAFARWEADGRPSL